MDKKRIKPMPNKPISKEQRLRLEEELSDIEDALANEAAEPNSFSWSLAEDRIEEIKKLLKIK